MNPIIKYTLLAYEQNYNDLLSIYLSNYLDVAELDFVMSEIYTYKICFDVIDYIDKNYKEFISSYNVESLNYPKPKKFQSLSVEYSNFNFSTIAKEIISFKGSSYNQSIVQRQLSFGKIISFLEVRKAELERKKNTISPKTLLLEEIESKHENIFFNNGYVLFRHILDEYVRAERGRLSDINFFYWSMFNDTHGFIHQGIERFKEWFFVTFDEDLGKFKTYNQVKNIHRQKHYAAALEWFKSQKK